MQAATRHPTRMNCVLCGKTGGGEVVFISGLLRRIITVSLSFLRSHANFMPTGLINILIDLIYKYLIFIDLWLI
jgi:hypothetical protein